MRKNIVIEVVTSETYGKVWEQVDTYQDQQMTIQHISNLLTGVDSITASSTLSVKLPRTVRNDRVFDLATRPQHPSSMTHRKIECRVHINGIDMMKNAYCYLLDSEFDNYEVCIVFGLMQHYGKWISDRPRLRDLTDHGEFIRWDGKCAVDCTSVWWSNYPSRYESVLGPANGHNLASQFYALYNCGSARNATSLNYFNMHPCVTLREIYERIISENNLNFFMPQSVLLDMEELAIVQVERNQPDQGETHPTAASPNARDDVYPSGYGQIQARLGGLCGRVALPTSNYYKTTSGIGYWIYYGDGSVTVEFDFKLQPLNTNNNFAQLFKWLLQLYNTLDYICLVICDFTTGTIRKFKPYSYTTSGGNVTGIRFRGTYSVTNTDNLTEGSTMLEMAIWLDPEIMHLDTTVSSILAYYFNLGGASGNQAFTADGTQQLDVRYSFDLANGFQYTYIEGAIPYPNNFQLIPNLPNISQLDFVKVICQMYCLFPVVDSADEEIIRFVPFDTLQNNITGAYDWSDKLLEYARDVPKRISFRAGDYARNNIIKYKDDDNEKYPFHSEAVLQIDDNTLEKEKTLVEFPWAATRVDRITQYELKQETDDNEPPTITYEAEFTQCEYRIMRITEWQRQSDCANVAQFQNLDAEYILATYYATYQAAIMQPRIITEHVRLNELEMRDVDFTHPVYLSKYGRYFAIKQIQWTVGDEYAEVELLLLGAANQQIIN